MALTSVACAAPVSDNDIAWREVRSAESKSPAPASKSPTDSLGDPFVVVADRSSMSVRTTELARTDADAARVESAWLMLSSDACDVVLNSMNVAFWADGHDDVSPASWLTTTSSAKGLVVDSSTHSAIVRFDLDVRVDRYASGGSGASRSAFLEVRLEQRNERVEVSATLRMQLADGSQMQLPFSIGGGFEQDAEGIPERRGDCPR